MTNTDSDIGWRCTMTSTPYTSLMMSERRTSSGGPMARMVPLWMRMSVSKYFAARLRSWNAAMTVRFLPLASAWMVESTSIWCVISRLDVGSSNNSTSGSCASARAMIARWRSPPLILVMSLSRRCQMFVASMADRTMAKSSSVSWRLTWGDRPILHIS